MQLVRPVIASDPRTFGRRIRRALADSSVRKGTSDELRTFATTFLAGFVFVSVLLA